MVANSKSFTDADGTLIVRLVVVTCVDEAVAKFPELIEASATVLTHNKITAPTAATIKTPAGPFVKKESARFFI